MNLRVMENFKTADLLQDYSGIIVIVIAISWCWEWVGGIVFKILEELSVVMSLGGLHWSVCLLMSGPLFLIGVLLWLNLLLQRAASVE